METVDLPEDIVRNILSRLPVKSLLRFRSVCKSWCSLFRNPDFIAENHNYGSLNLPCTSLFLEEDRFYVLSDVNGIDADEILTVFTPFFFEYPVIKGSVNGLICLHDVDKDLVALWNPATREFKPIPFPLFKPLPGSIKAYTSNIGFGFDKKTNDYKILRFVMNRFDEETKYIEQVQLYSLKNDSWKEISFVDDVFTSHNEMRLNPYMDGVSFWWGQRTRSGKEVFVLSFDFENEMFGKLLLPNSGIALGFPYDDSQLEIINGMLSIIGYNEENDEETEEILVSWINIWAMTQHGVKESWKEVQAPIHFDGCMIPVGFWKNHLLLKDFSRDEKLALFDLSTKQMYDSELGGDIQVACYVESLVPINGR